MNRSEHAPGGLGLPPVLKQFWIWIAVSSLASLSFTLAMILILHNRFAYGVLALQRKDEWWDFLAFADRFKLFRAPAFWTAPGYPFTYPAFLGMVFAVAYRIPHALSLYLLSCLAALLAWAWVVARQIAMLCGSSRSITLLFTLTIVATAWPVFLLLTSGNIEGLLAVVLGAGIWAVLRRSYWLAAALIACAGAMKIFPLVVLALLLSRRRYKQFAAAIALAIALTVGSLAIMGPTVAEAQRHIAAGLTFVKYTYATNVHSSMADVSHSLFSPIKFTVVALNRLMHPATWQQNQATIVNFAYTTYIPATAVLGTLLYFLRIRHLPMLNQIFALTICGLLLPPFSVDYTLIQLFLPLGLLLVYTTEMWRRGIAVAGLRACYVCFAFLYPVGTFFTIRYRFGSMVRCVALTGLLVVVLRHRFAWSELDQPEAPQPHLQGEPA